MGSSLHNTQMTLYVCMRMGGHVGASDASGLPAPDPAVASCDMPQAKLALCTGQMSYEVIVIPLSSCRGNCAVCPLNWLCLLGSSCFGSTSWQMCTHEKKCSCMHACMHSCMQRP